MVEIIGFFSAARPPSKKGWSNQDLGELYRVEGALLQAGLRIETESGVSDEGDPWFAFCHGDNGELIIHFARIDGCYVVAAPALPKPLRGADLGSIVRQFIAENPVSLPVLEANRRGNILFHPAALLTIFVATILIMSSPSEGLAAGSEGARGGEEAASLAAPHGLPDGLGQDDSRQRAGEKTAMLLIAAAIATEMVLQQEDHTAENASAAPGQSASLAHVFGQEGETDAGIHDWFGLSDAFFAPGQETSKEQALFPDPEDEIVLPDGFALKIGTSGANLKIGTSGMKECQIVLSPSGDETLPMPAERPTTDHAAGATPAVVVWGWPQEALTESPAQEPVQAVQEPVQVALPHEPAGTARGWIEERIRADYLRLMILDPEQVPGVADVVDMDVLVETAGVVEVVDMDVLEETADAGAVEVAADSHPAFDEGARQAVLHFLDSDDDIAIVSSANGSIVIFDQSDLASGEALTSKTWVYEETTTISIVGHSDTIADAMGLVA